MTTESEVESQQTEPPEGPGPVLDIGIYIAALVGIYGVILLVYGALGSPDNSKSLGHPFNIWWGAVMLAVALVIAGGSFLGRRATRRRAVRDHGAAGDGPPDWPAGDDE